MKLLIATICLSILFAALAGGAEAVASKEVVEIASGTATFEVGTNMPGIEVKGKSTALSGQVAVLEDGGGLLLQGVDVSLQVKSLATGMKLRDEHMRKYIFTTGDGQEPDLRYTAGTGSCTGAGGSRQFTCQVAGNLNIRGVSRPFEIRLHVKQQGGPGSAFRAEGDGIVKLSDYGIPAPTQFGVRTSNEVRLHLDFGGKPKLASTASRQGGQ